MTHPTTNKPPSNWEVRIVQNGFTIREFCNPDGVSFIAQTPEDVSSIFAQLQREVHPTTSQSTDLVKKNEEVQNSTT